jgi:NAD(P)-dependent dehydrogenase (short-subunit alcohol dehydrogenase family)
MKVSVGPRRQYQSGMVEAAAFWSTVSASTYRQGKRVAGLPNPTRRRDPRRGNADFGAFLTMNRLDREPFGATTTASEVVSGINLEGKRMIVTGASSGIGLETARALASAGAEVTLAVRNESAGRRAAGDIANTVPHANLKVAQLDLADHDSVVNFVCRWRGALDVLVNNAGIMAPPEQRTREGWELQFATNHLGHFALSLGLHAALALAANPRLVVVSSVGHINSEVLFDDIHFVRHPYDPWIAYAQSKTANILFAVEAARRWAATPVRVNALNPGRIWDTNLKRYMAAGSGGPAAFAPKSTDVSYKDLKQGAATSVLLAASPLVSGVTGKYFEDCAIAAPYKEGVRRGVAPYALDLVKGGLLWNVSLQMIAAAHPRSPILVNSS